MNRMTLLVRFIFTFTALYTAVQCVTIQNRFPVKTSRCNTFEWECDNGQCIDSSDQCDGVRNCNDGSDETTENCIATTCPRYGFRCSYGACVSGNAECNHKTECADGSDEMTAKCPSKSADELRGSCKEGEFQCDNYECIGDDGLCDGKGDCSDNSDEQVKYCAASYCPSYAFKCGYGGCIGGKKKCDGRNDCVDGSDENYLLCGRNRTTTSKPTVSQNQNRPQVPNIGFTTPTTTQVSASAGSCRADNIPNNGDAYLLYSDMKIAYRELLDNLTIISYKCIDNHYLIGNATNTCLNGRWLSAKPACKALCAATDVQGVTISANCHVRVNNSQTWTSCTRPVEPGTVAHISCKGGYEKRGPQQTSTCTSGGRWTPEPVRCSQICGEVSEGTAYIVGGATTNISRVPWHAGIYRRSGLDRQFDQICGGTIINAKVIISAMHCFWDPSEGTAYNIDAYEIVVGKTVRKYEAREEYKPQFFEIEDIFYIDGYSDFQSYYASDIVLVVLNKYIEFHSFIVPICLPQNLQYHDKVVPVGWIGTAAGWGLVESNGRPSEVLKKIELPVVSREDCRENSSPEFANYKFCAGYLTGASVCQGDSGGGLVFPQTVGQKTVYFLRGIVSTGGNKAGSCDNDKYSTYTNVAYHMDFINAYLPRYEPKF